MKFEEECSNCKHYESAPEGEVWFVQIPGWFFGHDTYTFEGRCFLYPLTMNIESKHHKCKQFVYDKKNDLPKYLFR